MKLASKEGQLFAYVPDYYLDSLVEICTALCTYIHPAAPIENIEGTTIPCLNGNNVLDKKFSVGLPYSVLRIDYNKTEEQRQMSEMFHTEGQSETLLLCFVT
jgi:hypothetical protein